MNKLVRYKGVLTVLTPYKDKYYTFPIDDYTIDIPEYIKLDDPNIQTIQISKLHFSEARAIIKTFVDDYELVTASLDEGGMDYDDEDDDESTPNLSGDGKLLFNLNAYKYVEY